MALEVTVGPPVITITLAINPVLPHWLTDITLRRLRVGKAKVDIRFWREGEVTRHDVLDIDGQLKVERVETK